ncbi:MAG: hypothetical protein QXH08_06300, partial [Candidatus Hadarchaeales archaeon]
MTKMMTTILLEQREFIDAVTIARTLLKSGLQIEAEANLGIRTKEGERGRGGELVIESTDRQVSLECRIPATIEVVGAEKGTGEDEVIYLPSI